MKLHWYELVFRGISPGCFPRGPVATEHNHINYKGRKFGAVAYDEPLTEQQVSSYELVAIDPLRDMNDVELYLYENKQ